MISPHLDNSGMSLGGFAVIVRVLIRSRYHAWESLAMGYLGELSPYKIRTVESSFNRMVRP